MKFLNISSLVVIGAVSTFLSSRAPASPPMARSPSAPADGKKFACGEKENPCPMQKWMKANMAPAAANADSDPAALVKAFEYVASHAPKGFSEWSAIAKKGAADASAKNIDEAKKACKSCHDKYKGKYKEEKRDDPF